ncbi:carbonic anhydrase [Plebeiibacterium marinum]|uniref:Carbonic anhydrase 2 n=1 Tax=Plebeiibacterium marinum TaxID=2992111 RepID=A0AAE3MD28_9BACT|nr:carbonic anhydrase [Plebeiobacterium marinum]MCW3805646.1 carbonic anhydrase [Plebeiobacterium marinum]
MLSLDHIFAKNKEWVKEKTREDTDYFKNLALGQSPKYLWIGCSDSRVPAAGHTHTEPGDFFVHRNIANQVITNDSNVMSVIKYAVDYLKVKHIVICGHYGCGGIAAAVDNNKDEYLGDWLSGIKDSYKKNSEILNKFDDKEEMLNKLSEINVERQIEKLSNTSIVQHAWERNQELFLHGWIFDLKSGHLKKLMDVKSPY